MIWYISWHLAAVLIDMNLLQQQAKTFTDYHLEPRDQFKEFISKVRSELYEYRKGAHKLEFLGHIINTVKSDYDIHLKVCTAKNPKDCYKNQFYENTLFFLQNEMEEIESRLDPTEFKRAEQEQLSSAVTKMITELEKLQLGQQITYDDLSEQLTELKDYYFLNKTNWTQLFLGKMTEMIASGVVSEALSKELVSVVKSTYPNLFN